MAERDQGIFEREAKAGTLLIVDEGCYSDYNVVGFFVVLRDFKPYEELEKWLASHPDQRDDYNYHADEFFASLLAQGLLLEIDYGELHLTGYLSLGEFFFRPVS